jgi:hypothetical protein
MLPAEYAADEPAPDDEPMCGQLWFGVVWLGVAWLGVAWDFCVLGVCTVPDGFEAAIATAPQAPAATAAAAGTTSSIRFDFTGAPFSRASDSAIEPPAHKEAL